MHPSYKFFFVVACVVEIILVCTWPSAVPYGGSNWIVSSIVVSAGHYDRPVVINFAFLRCLGIALHCHTTGLLSALEVALLLVPGYLYPDALCGADISAHRAGLCYV